MIKPTERSTKPQFSKGPSDCEHRLARRFHGRVLQDSSIFEPENINVTLMFFVVLKSNINVTLIFLDRRSKIGTIAIFKENQETNWFLRFSTSALLLCCFVALLLCCSPGPGPAQARQQSNEATKQQSNKAQPVLTITGPFRKLWFR